MFHIKLYAQVPRLNQPTTQVIQLYSQPVQLEDPAEATSNTSGTGAWNRHYSLLIRWKASTRWIIDCRRPTRLQVATPYLKDFSLKLGLGCSAYHDRMRWSRLLLQLHGACESSFPASWSLLHLAVVTKMLVVAAFKYFAMNKTFYSQFNLWNSACFFIPLVYLCLDIGIALWKSEPLQSYRQDRALHKNIA